MRKLFIYLFSGVASVICGCGGGGDGDSTPVQASPTEGSGTVSSKLDCGVIVNGQLLASVDQTTGDPILGIRFIDYRSAVVTLINGEQLVRLIGLESVSDKEGALSLLNTFVDNQLYLFRAADTCSVVFDGGGLGVKGAIITGGGKSLVEEVIKAGYAKGVETTGSCGEDLIAPCYSALADTYTPELPPSAGTMSNFLWKPKAESAYNEGLPVIHVNPCADVYVNGEGPIKDFGPGNGRCVTARLFKSCGSFGSNIKVEVFQTGTQIPYLDPRTGLPYVTVPSGCDRYEFIG